MRTIQHTQSIEMDLKEVYTWISMVCKLAEVCTKIHVLPYGPFENRPHEALWGQCIEVKFEVQSCLDMAYDFGSGYKEYLLSKDAKPNRKRVKSSILVLADMLQHTTADHCKDRDCIETMRSLTKKALSVIYNSRNW